jgi:biotin carboxyl carrier protein
MRMHVQIDEQKYEVEVGELTEQPVQVVVDGEQFNVWVEEDDSAAAMATSASAAAAQPDQPRKLEPRPAPVQVASGPSKSVAAPIPGVILSVGVKPGDLVKTGQELCVLEAMKMKNTIRAARDGKIASVHVSAGDHVTHGQALMDYTE